VTGYLGDCDSDVLILGEAPSTAGGKSPGLLTVCPSLSSTFNCPLYSTPCAAHSSCKASSLRAGPDLIGDAVYRSPIGNGLWPFFSDISKCYKVDFGKQSGCCFPTILEEIGIIQPKHIVCCGHDVFDSFKTLIYFYISMPGFAGLWRGYKRGSITVYRVNHYSHRFSTLADLFNVIWPYQLLKTPKIPSPKLTKISKAGISVTWLVKNSTFTI
jgi:hypothetical protein